MQIITLLLCLFLGVGCAKDPPQPAPMFSGKCVVMKYRTDIPAESICLYNGYKYNCNEDAAVTRMFWCTNVGEATGELVK